MHYHFLVFISLLFPFCPLNSQEERKDSCLLKPYSTDAGIGFYKTAFSYLNIEEQRTVAPGSSLLQREMVLPDGFPSNGDLRVKSLNYFLHAQFLPYNSKTHQYAKKCLIEFGLQYEKSRIAGTSYFHETSPARYDTLAFISYDYFGVPYHDTIFHDTLWYSYRYFSMKRSVICGAFGASVHSSDENQLSCGIGLNMQLGMVLARADILCETSQQYVSHYKPGYSDTISFHNLVASGVTQPTETENIKLKSVFFLRLNAPLSFQFRLSERPCFFNRVAITGTLNGALLLNAFPGIGCTLKYQQGLSCGLKYYLQTAPLKPKRNTEAR